MFGTCTKSHAVTRKHLGDLCIKCKPDDTCNRDYCVRIVCVIENVNYDELSSDDKLKVDEFIENTVDMFKYEIDQKHSIRTEPFRHAMETGTIKIVDNKVIMTFSSSLNEMDILDAVESELISGYFNDDATPEIEFDIGEYRVWYEGKVLYDQQQSSIISSRMFDI